VSLFPDNDKLRKMLPMFSYFARYFPKAHREVTKVCVVNNVRYNPERKANDINWARTKSPLQLDSAFHHMLEHAVDGKVFEEVPKEVAEATGIERVYILAEAAWRIHAELELTIEKVEAEEEIKAAAAQRFTIGETVDDVTPIVFGAPRAAQEAIEELREPGPRGFDAPGPMVEVKGKYGTTVAPLNAIPTVRC
jgi:hypothetical protein